MAVLISRNQSPKYVSLKRIFEPDCRINKNKCSSVGQPLRRCCWKLRKAKEIADVVKRIYLFIEIGWVGVDWIHEAQDTDGWWAVVNAVMNLRVP
jgi:hypothetical protein